MSKNKGAAIVGLAVGVAMQVAPVPVVPAGSARRSLARRFQRPGLPGRVLMTSAMLGLALAFSAVGVIAHADQQETTKRLAMQRERNLEALGIVVSRSAASRVQTTVIAASEPQGHTASESRAAR